LSEQNESPESDNGFGVKPITPQNETLKKGGQALFWKKNQINAAKNGLAGPAGH